MAWMNDAARSIAQATARKRARVLGGRMGEAAKYLEQRLQWVLDRVTSRVLTAGRGGKFWATSQYRALTPAAPGEPPRKVSGRGFRGVRVYARGSILVVTNVASSPRGFTYMQHHEGRDVSYSPERGGTSWRPGRHRWVVPTVIAYWHDLKNYGVTKVVMV